MGLILTFQQAMEEVADRCGGRRDQMQRIEDALNEAQLAFARADIELPALERVATFTTTAPFQNGASTAEYNLRTVLGFDGTDPHDFNLPGLIGLRLVRNNTASLLCKRMAWRRYRGLSSQAVGQPTAFARHGDILALDPNPDATVPTQTIQLDYRREPLVGVLEYRGRFCDDLMTYAAGLFYKKVTEYELCRAQMSLLPVWLQSRLAVELTEAEWEAMWDSGMGLEPVDEMGGWP